MFSPITGTAVRSLLTGEKAPLSLEGMALDRFDLRGTDSDFQPVGGGAMRE